MIQKRIGGAHQTSLTTATFTEFVQAHRFVVIHFWATWNRYDDQMQILLGKLGSEKIWESIAFACVDVDLPENHVLCRQHNIINLPFLSFYREGILTQNFIGMKPQEAIDEYLKEFANEND